MGFFREIFAAGSHSEVSGEQELFSLLIQPAVDFRTGCAFTGEALSRLNHPERGTVSADVFIPALDILGLGARFDRHIFQKCCHWLHRSEMEGQRCDLRTRSV